MYKLLPKNKKIAYVLIVFFVIVAAVFIWNNYQIEVSERPIKPLKPPAVISRKCGIEQCHGLDITCGPNIPDSCTMEASLSDICRQYVRCEKIDRECQLIKDPKFAECKSCIERCERENDPEKTFQCADGCANDTSENNLIPEIPPAKVVFNDQIYVPAKCISPSSSQVVEIGRTVEGYNVYQEETGKNEGILLKRQDGDYQCFTKGADYVTGFTSQDLEKGWYWGFENQRKPGTPSDWIFSEAGRSSCWHKPQVNCS